jgi:hypothetical protein
MSTEKGCEEGNAWFLRMILKIERMEKRGKSIFSFSIGYFLIIINGHEKYPV